MVDLMLLCVGKISGSWQHPNFSTFFGFGLTKAGGRRYKPPVGQGLGVSGTLHLRTKILWSGHIAAET